MTERFEPQTGDFLAETLWTDVRVWEVIRRTQKTITVRKTIRGEEVKRENYDGNPYPCIWFEAIPEPNGYTQTLRLRKDGTYRTGPGANRMRPAELIGGKPVSYTDYRE